jgi:hypothetical protein
VWGGLSPTANRRPCRRRWPGSRALAHPSGTALSARLGKPLFRDSCAVLAGQRQTRDFTDAFVGGM